MLTRRGLLRGLAQIAVLGPLALSRLPKVLEDRRTVRVIELWHREDFPDFYVSMILRSRKELLAWQDSGLPVAALTPGATS